MLTRQNGGIVEMEECEFCGRKVRKVGTTSMTGAYCRSCLELTIGECEEAISDITGKPYQRKELEDKEKKAEYEESLESLIKGISLQGEYNGDTDAT